MKALVLALLLSACAADPASRSLALTDQTVYVQCAFNGDTGQADDSDGDDSASGDEAHPLRTLQEVQRRYPQAPDGTTLIVQLCGWGGPAPCVQPSERRECRIANLHIGGTEVTRNTYQIRGPRKMITQAGIPASLTYVSAATAPGTTTGRSVRLTFSNATWTANAIAGRYLRVTDAAGAEQFYPLAIAANDNAGHLTIDSNLSAADIAAAAGEGVTWSVVIPAVSIRHPDAAIRGVVVSGFGASNFADSADPVWDGTIERVEINRPRFWADGLTLDNVLISGGGEMHGDASRHRQVSVILPGAYVIMGGSSAQGGGSSWTLYQEHAGRRLAVGDPVAYTSGQDLTVIGPTFIGGNFNFGVGIGQLRVHRSFSGRSVPWDVDGAVSVVGAGSVLHVTDAGYLFLEHMAPAGVCVWAKEGGRVRARFVGHVDMVGCPGGELQVDTDMPVGVAALLESAEKIIVGAFGSQIRDKQAEDEHYYGTNGNGGQG